MRVLITGANRGIGLGLVERYLQAGADVVATARNVSSEADAPLSQWLDKANGKLQIVELDITKEQSCRELAQKIAGQPLDILINNAGVGGSWEQRFEELDFSALLDVIQTNAVGPLRVTAALASKLKRPGAKVVMMTSRMGSIGDNDSGGSYAYRMSKAALNAGARSLSINWKRDGISVFIVHPGWVQTRMGGERAPVPVKDAAAQIHTLVDRLTLEDSGKFFHANGDELPW